MIPVSRPDLGALERAYLLDAFDSGWISSRGDYLARAEAELARVGGTRWAATTTNGTTALHLALLAIGVGPGDEVIIPSLSYVATLNAVLYVGARPVIVDVDAGTWCVDPRAVAEAITPRTVAVLAVDLYGHPADYPALAALTSARGIHLVADAAESIGATLGGRSAGSLADVSTFSFFGNKVISSGEGGAVLTDDESIHHRVLQLRNQGNHPSRRYHHEVMGFNFRMTNLAAALLTAQLERSAELISSRRAVVAEYRRLLETDERLVLHQIVDTVSPSPWLFTLRIDGVSASQRDAVIEEMAGAGIETRPVFVPMQDMPYLDGKAEVSATPVARLVAQEGISLPTFPGLASEEIARICQALSDAIRRVRSR